MAELKSLVQMESVDVDTNHGLCEIQLLFGSVTKLERKDKVDVLVVSAFPDSYVPNPASVIGALKKDLHLSVAALAQDKEEDLRHLLSCWWSKPLEEEHSFNRILCFEGCFKRQVRSPVVVSDAFKALVSICKEKDITVMMPLLTSTDKEYSHQTMLRLMVETAIHWMRVGLPLKILKIVIFARYMDEIEQNPLLPYFRDLKTQWMKIFTQERAEPKEHPINYDVYLSYSMKDQEKVEKVKEKLREKYQDINIFSQHQNTNQESAWQDEVYQVMVTCARVITLLSPNYVADSDCLEQYNIALCCSRSMKRDYLAPFYIDTIDELPTYMSLIQYFDCRPFDGGKVSQACSVITEWLKGHIAEIHHLSLKTQSVLSCGKHTDYTNYDVFISYSHQNSNVARRIKEHLLTYYPNWKIFIDVAELKTGTAWQAKLYTSIESSRIVIVLLSPSYLASKVCQEEYNLASAMHSDFAYNTKLLPLLVDKIEKLPSWCRKYTPIDCRDISDKFLAHIIKKVNMFKEFEQLDKPAITSIEDITSDWRNEHLLANLCFLPGVNVNDIMMQMPTEMPINTEDTSTDIALSFDMADVEHAEFTLERLRYYLPAARFSLPKESEVRNSILDQSLIIVAFLSQAFTKSAELSEELNIALCRQRLSNTLVLFPIVLGPLPSRPAYFRLLWSLFSCTDKVWKGNRFWSNAQNDAAWSECQRCLDAAARMIAFIISNKELFQGSFKTLLSTEELTESSLRLRGKQPVNADQCNPLYFKS